jgi:hypothetical protein
MDGVLPSVAGAAEGGKMRLRLAQKWPNLSSRASIVASSRRRAHDRPAMSPLTPEEQRRTNAEGVVRGIHEERGEDPLPPTSVALLVSVAI